MDPVFLIGLAGSCLLGLIFGSFATALIHRIPAGIPWAFGKRGGDAMPRSACPHCGMTLQVIDLIPIFSWLFLGGRCRGCHHPIGWMYPSVELATMLGCIALYCVWGLTISTFAAMCAVPLLAALTVIDLRHLMLPNILNILLAGVWMAFIAAQFGDVGFALAFRSAWIGLLGGVVYGLLSFGLGLLMKKLLKKDALGLGDVKFFAVAGLWLGPMMLPYFLMIAGILGVLMGMVYRIVRKEAYFPFGPALIGAFYLLLLCVRPGLMI